MPARKASVCFWVLASTTVFSLSQLARATVDDIDASYITGPDDVRARSIRDLLASAKNSLKKRDPALAARLKIPIMEARESARLNQLLEERTRLLIKADKTLAELDRLRQLRQEIKQLQRDSEMQWARLTGVTITRLVNGKTVEERVPLNPRDFYMHDKLWKVFKYVAASHPGLKFEHIYNFIFEVMVSAMRSRPKAVFERLAGSSSLLLLLASYYYYVLLLLSSVVESDLLLSGQEETTRQQWKEQLAAARKAAKKEAKERKVRCLTPA